MAQRNYAQPAKRINTESDVEPFRRSLAFKHLYLVIAFLIEKVHGCEVRRGFLDPRIVTRDGDCGDAPLEDDMEAATSQFSKPGVLILGIFDRLNTIIDETPPLDGPRRFGNMACRDWHKKVRAQSLDMLTPLVQDAGAKMELNHYLVNSFGSETRLDFGSGHELSFLAFVGGLLQAGILATEVTGSELLAIFARYYDLARRIILAYNLEPAGSHGVWGLDDHFHFIYILGAAQFTTPHNDTPVSYVPPVRQTLSPEIIRSYRLSNFYINAISFIFRLKLGPFNEHSPILFDITRSVSLWAKVQSGLLKMYEVEVLGKFPVVQHFWFGGKFFPWADATTNFDFATNTASSDGSSVPKLEDSAIPGLINDFQGTHTTRSNIAITRAPWAKTRNPRLSSTKVNDASQKSQPFLAKHSGQREPSS